MEALEEGHRKRENSREGKTLGKASHTLLHYGMDNQMEDHWGRMEFCSMLCASLDGKVWGRMEACVCTGLSPSLSI